MTKQEIFEYVVNHWYLKDGVVYAYKTQNPVAFASVDYGGHLYQSIRINNGGYFSIRIHQAVFMLYHNRPIGEGMHIHHIDGNPLNNDPLNLVELTPLQHRRLHTYQSNDQMRGIRLHGWRWEYRWYDDSGHRRSKYFHGINEAMQFRAEIEAPYRAELRALGLDC